MDSGITNMEDSPVLPIACWMTLDTVPLLGAPWPFTQAFLGLCAFKASCRISGFCNLGSVPVPLAQRVTLGLTPSGF